MWSGLISNIPAGWLLCDGTKSTPNLTDKFIYGVSSALENPGVTGGDSVHAFQVPMTTIISGAASTSQLGWNNGSSDMDNKEGATWYYPQTGGSYSTLSSPNNYYGTAPTTTGIGNTMPPYYKLAFIIKQ
jgi:hypothetical protein